MLMSRSLFRLSSCRFVHEPYCFPEHVFMRGNSRRGLPVGTLRRCLVCALRPTLKYPMINMANYQTRTLPRQITSRLDMFLRVALVPTLQSPPVIKPFLSNGTTARAHPSMLFLY